MRRKIVIIIVSLVTILTGTGIGVGIYSWLNPLGSTDENLEPGTILSEGTFVQIDSSHWGRGKAQIVHVASDNLQVQLVEVEIANGPDLFVYLSDKSSFQGISDSPGNFINVGRLSSNKGNFSYNIPSDSDIGDIKAVLIWCRAFAVLFTYAVLS
ncbi:MAG: DM13 domain-containing protein [Promethearchaeota archaeon]|jgi:hypothetical protein